MIVTETQESLETETEETPCVSEDAKDPKNFAAMNGVSIDIDLKAGESLLQEVPEPEEIVTTRTVSQNPLLKIIVIGGGILIFVMLIGGVINGSMNALKLSTTKKIEPTQQPQEVAEAVKDETGTDKAALALTRQSLEMQKMRDLKATPKATPTPIPTSKSVPVRQAAPAPQPRTVVQRPVQRTPEPIKLQQVVQPPAVKTQPKPQSQAITTAKAPVIDPMQQWLAVSNVGSFGANTPQLVSDGSESAERIEGGLGKPKPKPASLTVSSKDKQTKKPENIDYSQARVLVGTRAEGKLETPIVWSRSTQNQSNQNYLIRLSKPLKASNGSEVLPLDSYIVAQIRGGGQSEYVQLQAVSALVNNNGNTEEHSIPEGTILILAKNSQLLKAESRKGSDLVGTIFSAVLNGVAKAAEIQNRPSSQITTNSDGFSSSTTSDDNKDLLAGFAEGTLGEMVRGIQANNQRQNQQLQSQGQVFVVEAGKEVQIFVNETFSL